MAWNLSKYLSDFSFTLPSLYHRDRGEIIFQVDIHAKDQSSQVSKSTQQSSSFRTSQSSFFQDAIEVEKKSEQSGSLSLGQFTKILQNVLLPSSIYYSHFSTLLLDNGILGCQQSPFTFTIYCLKKDILSFVIFHRTQYSAA